MKLSAALLVLLLLCVPAMAGPPPPSGAAPQDDDASAHVNEHPPTARILERLQTDRAFLVKDAAAQLAEAQDNETLDKVVGHLRWVIRSNHEGEARLVAYELLRALQSVGHADFREIRAAGRDDVADQFISGLDDAQEEIRRISADGLRPAPSGRRDAAGVALLDRLGREADPHVYHALLESLTKVATPALESRVGELLAVLAKDQPSNVAAGLAVAWKTDAATAVLAIVGPEEATKLFGELDSSKPGERLGIEGAAGALTMFGGEHFPDMDPARRDEIRDRFRAYGIGMLSMEDREGTEGDERASIVTLQLFGVVLGRPKEWRPVDVEEIRVAVQAAVAQRRQGSRIASDFIQFLELLQYPRRGQR